MDRLVGREVTKSPSDLNTLCACLQTRKIDHVGIGRVTSPSPPSLPNLTLSCTGDIHLIWSNFEGIFNRGGLKLHRGHTFDMGRQFFNRAGLKLHRGHTFDMGRQF